MRLKEQRLWDTMKRNAPTTGVWLDRVENIMVDGMPDVHVGARRWTWVELKAPKRPKRATTPLMGAKEGLRVSQVGWHMKAASMGLPSWILIRDDQRQLYLVSGSYAAEVNDMTASQLMEISVADNWTAIFGELTK